MKKNKLAPETVEYYKTKIDALRKELDYLEGHGSQSVKEAHCSREIGRLQKQLKKAHGIEY
jgi:hypothetical protein